MPKPKQVDEVTLLDDDTREALAGVGEQEWIQDYLIRGMKMRAKAKALEEEFNALKAEGGELLTAALGALGLKKAKMEGLGTAFDKKGTNASVSGKKAREELINRGVDPAVAAAAIEAATTTKTYTYIEFRTK